MFKKENQKYNLISYTNEEEMTLKEVLLDKLNFSVRSLSKMKREKSVLVNGVYKKPSLKVSRGDLIEVKIEEEKANFEPQDLNLQIIYDDFDIIMVNKPPFMVVHPTKSHYDNTIANGISYYIEKHKENVKIRFVNRLDMNTSGLVIVAKNAYAHHTLSTSMSENKVEKTYITVVNGIIDEDEGTINEPIYRPEEDSIKRVIDERGQASVTHYKVVERLKNATVLEVKLETGRTHQIRVHMAHIGHGIIGDELYGYIDGNLINRQALHAYSLEFEQPRTKEILKFKTDIPKDMQELISKLR
ncbi:MULTISPECIES: RluA family pseudouridine synthase [unclassified Clostridioides]|uniref:RluA family pseudouridine synthase n=1 Tax=unclassified Clostridioides TaxID=2635829 RepID=UPI001D0C61F4|nr:RluA family pseudouridine synthase [Clostridioides sp. ES-S-0001-02]MCC0651581.1 RluA family pseudouridine synthase [Clostridioides sp. ES-S-0001-03]MCC0657387.1 RluA family pseudouridine synthase [Clostridioides sp. ES-S-0123-01]MCC0672792.1 RluA family pseudouridine synthase [Clostridioides sp. ES-S-0145-01]MCC0693971.1 RluA family pseudouridine synthase [Clostridioides sp. ES-S-0048-02]UDN57531.1 RluA family pseudouridine synthase [Clostridioides sp. ES-S-0010-02]UDN62876.1 RluA family 